MFYDVTFHAEAERTYMCFKSQRELSRAITTPLVVLCAGLGRKKKLESYAYVDILHELHTKDSSKG